MDARRLFVLVGLVFATSVSSFSSRRRDSPTQLLQSGLVALQHGELAQARDAFEEVTKRDPHNAFAWASLAETYARSNSRRLPRVLPAKRRIWRR